MWGCSLPGTRLLMNIQKPERRGRLNPLLAGRPEGGPSPLRAGTGYEPGRLGGGEAPGDRPPPHCWDRALQPQMYVAPPPPESAPPIPEPEGSTVADSSLPKLHRVLRDPRSPGPSVQARGPQISRCPAPPPGGARSPGHQRCATLEAELPAPGFQEFRIPDRRFPPEFPRKLSPGLPGFEELGIRTPSAPSSPFGVEAPATSRGPWNLGLPALPPGVGLIPALRVRGTQESGTPTPRPHLEDSRIWVPSTPI